MKTAPLYLLCLTLLVQATGALAGESAGKWVGTWVSAQQLVEPGNLPPAPGLAGHTLRQIIQPKLAGTQLRLTYSNEFGDGPLTIAAVSVARSAGRWSIEPNSACPVTFAGQPQVTLQPGATVMSDPVPFAVRPFENLAVSTYCTTVPANVTGHPGSRMTSFIQEGEAVLAADLPRSKSTDHWYLLAAADVWADPQAAAIVVIGDSITDGRGSTTNGNDRWPDNLARRLHADPRTAGIAVLNQGIGGNCVLRYGLGPPAQQRFDRDVLVPPGVRWVIIFEGINDLGSAGGAHAKGEPDHTVENLTGAYAHMIERARAHGLRVYGATITPFEGFTMYYNPAREAVRQAVNAWIRTKGNFDGVIDFDALARDAKNPGRLSAAVDGGDHLHLSARGYQIIADGIDLSLFSPGDHQ